MSSAVFDDQDTELSVVIARNTSNWPRQIQLNPSREQAVPLPVLTEWMKKHQCIAFAVTPLPDLGMDSAENHKALVRLLTEKNIVSTHPS